ncbi:MAG: portal protein, partial [candidate division WOR-3 bacterium]
EDEKAIITEEKRKTSPYLPVRMPTYSGETYGRGPAYFCLPAIKTLNYYAYNRRESFGYVTNPRYIVRDNVNIKGWEDVGPGGLLYASGVGDVGPGAIRELSSVTHPEYYRIMASFEEDAIRKAFFADQIEFWMERPQDMKAGVASEMGGRNRILLAPVLTAVSQTFVIPAVIKTIDTIFSAMVNRTDELKVTIPEQIMKNGMNIEITGPLAIAQKAARLSGYREFLADISPVIQMFPDTVQALNGDEIVRSLADSWYIPAGMINSTEKVIAARRAQQQKQQLEEQVGMLERGAPAMLDIAKATKELA